MLARYALTDDELALFVSDTTLDTSVKQVLLDNKVQLVIWTYSLNDAKDTIRISSTGTTTGDTFDGGTVALSYNATDGVAVTTKSNDWVGGDYTIYYTTQDDTTYEDESTDAPTAVGAYKAYITVNDVTAYVTYTIAAATVTFTMADDGTVSTTATLATGSSYTVTYAPTTGGGEVTTVTYTVAANGSVSTEDTLPTDAGTYTVTVAFSDTDDDNYSVAYGDNDATSFTLTIDTVPATITATENTSDSESDELVYDLSTDGTLDVTYSVSPTDNTTVDDDADTLTITAAGEYTVTATYDSDKTITKTITVYKVEFNENGGTAGSLTSTLVTSGGTVSKPDSDPTLTNYEFDCWMNGETEFNFATDTVDTNLTLKATWKIAALEEVDVTSPDSKSVTYGTTITLSAPTTDETDVSYEYQWYKWDATAGEYEAVANEEGSTLTLTDVADSGDYIVGVVVVAGEDKSDETTSDPNSPATVKITPMVITELDWTGLDATYTYNGTDRMTSISASFTGVGEDGTIDLTLAWVVDNSNSDVFINAGDYTITPSIADNSNYVFSEDEEVDYTKTVTMEKATLTAAWTNTTQTYTGSALEPDVTFIGYVNSETESVLTDLSVTSNIPAGTYTVTASTTNDNYTISNPTTTFTISKAAVSFEMDANGVVTAYVDGAELVSSAYTVTYTDANGDTYSSLREVSDGEYTVSVTLADTANYYINGTTAATEGTIGTYTVGDDATTNTAYFGTTDEVGTTANVGSPIVISGVPVSDPTLGTFIGWEYDGVIYAVGDMFIMPEGDVEFTAAYETTYDIDGTVTQTVTNAANNPIEGAVVTLMLGNTVVAETTTDEKGEFTFTDVAVGLYNIVTTYDGITVTVIEDLQSNDSLAIVLPEGKTNSIVTVTDGTPAVVVGNLDGEFTDAEITNAVDNGHTIDVVMTVDETSATVDADEKTAIEAEGSDVIDMYLDISITKYTTPDNGSTAETPITGTTNTIEIVVPYTFTGKYNVTVFRYHGTEAETFTESTTKADGTYILDEAAGRIYIYAEKFSTYAVGYDTSPTVTSSGSSGSVSISTYAITVDDTDNGSVSVSNSRPTYGTPVTITTSPDDGYVVGTVTVTTASGTELTVTDNGDGTYSFKQLGSKVTITVTYVEDDGDTSGDSDDSFFTDVSVDDWFYDAVKWAVDNGITTGKTSSLFAPWDINTRGEAATFLWRSMGEPEVDNTEHPFNDIVEGWYYYDAILWGVEEGITVGTSDITFSPDMDCSRAHIITFLWRMMGKPVVDSENPFTDVEEGLYYYDAVLWAVSEGITTGTSDTTFSPNQDCARGEIVTFLYRCLAE